MPIHETIEALVGHRGASKVWRSVHKGICLRRRMSRVVNIAAAHEPDHEHNTSEGS